MSDNTSTLELDRKLMEIMRAIDFIPKTGTNEFHKYTFVQEAVVLEKMRGLFMEHGLLITPDARIAGQHGELTLIDVTFVITDVESGEKRRVSVPGAGNDKGDKGVYKAVTGAYKYLLLKLFLIPTGDDPEAFADTDQRAYGQSAPAPKAAAPSKPQAVDTGQLPRWEGDDAEYYCDGCGEEIKGSKRNSLAQVVKYSSVGNQLLCYNCRKSDKAA